MNYFEEIKLFNLNRIFLAIKYNKLRNDEKVSEGGIYLRNAIF